LLELSRQALAIKLADPQVAVLVLVSTILVVAGTLSSWAVIRGPAWAMALMGHAALANALSPGKGLVWQITWLVSGAVIGVVLGVWLGPGGSRRAAGVSDAEPMASAPAGPAGSAAGRLPITPARLVVLWGVVACVLLVRFLEDSNRVALQSRIAAAVERDEGVALFDDHSVSTLVFRWLDRPAKDESDRFRRSLTSVELGPDARDEQLLELGELGLAELPDLCALHLHRSQVADAGLAAVQPMVRLQRLSLGPGTTDAGLAQLTGLTGLHSLDLRSTQISGDGLRHPKELPGLMILNLNRTKITDADLARLKDCGNLASLYLSGTAVSDAGLAHLKDLPNLFFLELIDTGISDAGIVHLKEIPRLRWLFINKTRLTPAGLIELHKARPDIHVIPPPDYARITRAADLRP
jgi:hypothetical protein